MHLFQGNQHSIALRRRVRRRYHRVLFEPVRSNSKPWLGFGPKKWICKSVEVRFKLLNRSLTTPVGFFGSAMSSFQSCNLCCRATHATRRMSISGGASARSSRSFDDCATHPASVERSSSMPSRAKIWLWRHKGQWSAYLFTRTCARRPARCALWLPLRWHCPAIGKYPRTCGGHVPCRPFSDARSGSPQTDRGCIPVLQ